MLLRNVSILLGQVGVEPDEDEKGDPRGAAFLVLCQDLAGELQGGQEALQKKRGRGGNQQIHDCMTFEIEKVA